MVYHISIMTEEVNGFLREIQIDAQNSFLDLCQAVLKSVDFPDDQMTSFYLIGSDGRRHQQFTREDMGFGGSDAEEDVYTMEKEHLEDFIEDEEQLIEFVFDPFNDRTFSLQVMEVLPSKHLSEPITMRSLGNPPAQLVAPDFSLPAGHDLFDEDEMSEFYGSDDFESDEFDTEGFEVSDDNENF